MTRRARFAITAAAVLPLAFAAELAKEIGTSLTRYGATIAQAINAAGHWIITRQGLVNVALWAAFLFVCVVVLAIGSRRHRD
jgi:hypothetical protein